MRPLPKISRRNGENVSFDVRKCFWFDSFQKKFSPSNCSCGHLECSSDNLSKNFTVYVYKNSKRSLKNMLKLYFSPKKTNFSSIGFSGVVLFSFDDLAQTFGQEVNKSKGYKITFLRLFCFSGCSARHVESNFDKSPELFVKRLKNVFSKPEIDRQTVVF